MPGEEASGRLRGRGRGRTGLAKFGGVLGFLRFLASVPQAGSKGFFLPPPPGDAGSLGTRGEGTWAGPGVERGSGVFSGSRFQVRKEGGRRKHGAGRDTGAARPGPRGRESVRRPAERRARGGRGCVGRRSAGGGGKEERGEREGDGAAGKMLKMALGPGCREGEGRGCGRHDSRFERLGPRARLPLSGSSRRHGRKGAREPPFGLCFI